MSPSLEPLHFLGIAGTFMGSLALLAREMGHPVTGVDANVYPPMSTQLAEQGIAYVEGFDAPLPENARLIVGNVMKRGMPVIETMLDRGLPYTSGPQWLGERLLWNRWVIAVAGTHGKTSTASMIAWILDYAGMAPGFLIGGVPTNFGISARLGNSPFFVIEADEYDTAFFDKRSKFVHYHPRTLVLNNLEYDHADIFPDLAAIETQFHHLVRILPSSGLVIANADSDAIKRVLDRGCWTPVETFGQTGDWQVAGVDSISSRFDVVLKEQCQGSLEWSLLGEHNQTNALAAIAAARHAGVPVDVSLAALTEFKGVARRMELRGEVGDIRVYDDFAHHPTAIASTVAGLKNRYPDRRLIAVLDPRSNTMRMGVHREALRHSFKGADAVFIYAPDDLSWNPAETLASMAEPLTVCHTLDGLLAALLETLRAGDQVLVMSNGAFGGLHQRLLAALAQRSESA
ncbi:MAG TPA: UDP-N-acetylmuramate:L-alanyl-gamma-D-glutamyl-meso-diaminopimelate ligase [Halothiobacillus sp.]|nr:UDP-N-acetylmuramate:L-alanyl-gamma-D-glutamyl-meso-diaminopimelate ligase [Halothiobacillus sp.]